MVRSTTDRYKRRSGPGENPTVRFTSAGRQLTIADREIIKRRVLEDLAFVDHPSFQQCGLESLSGTDGVLAGEMAPFSKLLSREQEKELFLRMNYAKYRLREESRRARKDRMPIGTAKKILQLHRLESHMRDHLVERNLPLVLSMAKKTNIRGVDFGDMVSEGNMALLRAVDGFDCSRGFKFSTYACRAIMKSFARLATKTIRQRSRFPTEFDPAYEKSDWAETQREEAAQYCTEELVKILQSNSAGLSPAELAVIKGRFAFEDGQNRRTLVEMGQILGLTKERIRQIQKKAIGKLREALEAKLLGE
ncbi:MAG: sigma-70 family RNA polymerase sigma factor [Actinobacteria bacterium]|nr:sigma-70 family RNA polymerase sigma factor [Actinomycetota bacterium]